MKMTGNKCLLDTSVVIHFFKNSTQIIQALNSFEEVYVNSIVVGELYYGAYASLNPQKHIDQIQSFLNNCISIQIDANISVIYGQLK